MDEFMTAGMNVCLDGLAPSSKTNYTKKINSVLQFCERGTDDGPYEAILEDVSEYIINLHEIGYKTSTLWSTLSVILAFFEFGKDINVNSVKKLMDRHLRKRRNNNKS